MGHFEWTNYAPDGAEYHEEHTWQGYRYQAFACGTQHDLVGGRIMEYKFVAYSWDGFEYYGHMLTDIHFPNRTPQLDFKVRWAEIHTRHAYEAKFVLPLKDFAILDHGMLFVTLEVGTNGEIIVKSGAIDAPKGIYEIARYCARRAKELDAGYTDTLNYLWD